MQSYFFFLNNYIKSHQFLPFLIIIIIFGNYSAGIVLNTKTQRNKAFFGLTEDTMSSKVAYKVHNVLTLKAFVATFSRLLSLYLKNSSFLCFFVF